MNARSLIALMAAALTSAAAIAPVTAADLCHTAQFQCSGFEPNWQFTTTRNAAGESVVRFIDPENPNWETEPFVVRGCVLQGSPNDFEVTSDAPLSLIANIVGQSCTEPNDEVTDFSVTAAYNQGALTGAPNRIDGTGCCVRLD